MSAFCLVLRVAAFVGSLAGIAMGGLGCAQAVPKAASAKAEETTSFAVTETTPPLAVEPSRTRPRLSRTVTLGEGYAGASPAPAVAGTGPSVVVNNQITIVNTPPAVYGYGGYGYGGYGYGNYGSRGPSVSANSPAASLPSTNSFVNGVGAPAARGGVPVGGDWGSAPSYGPKSMR